jgi:hypothetical protein
MTTAEQAVRASRVTGVIPEAVKWLWMVQLHSLPKLSGWDHMTQATRNQVIRCINGGLLPGDDYTVLRRVTDATVHTGGEVVMEDTPHELQRHLPILLRARGRVLVSGLGLGCVVRGLLARPAVAHVDVVEVCPHVAALVWPYLQDLAGDRATLHLGDTLTYHWPRAMRWDYAWHDVWTEHGSLNELHMRIMTRYWRMVPRGHQGCWQLDRSFRHAMRRRALPVLEG